MPRMLPLAVLLALLLAACGRDDGGDPGAIADRILRLGEDHDAVVEVHVGALPPGLREALNPGSTAETPQSELIALPVHPEGELVGSFRIERADGSRDFWVLYDVAQDDRAVEEAIARQLDADGWQTIAGQSTASQSALRFQSTVSGDIEGTAIVRETPNEDGPLASVVYVLEIQPAQTPEDAAFELPEARPIPEGFPASFLVLEEMTPVSVLWSTSPAGHSYQMLLLSRQSAFDITEEYRRRLEAEGWDLADDRAVGFATVLDFSTTDGATSGTLTADTFEEDDSFTSVVLEVNTSTRASSGN